MSGFSANGKTYTTENVTDERGVGYLVVKPAQLDDVNDKVRASVVLTSTEDTVPEGQPSGFRGYQLVENYSHTPSTFKLNSKDFWGGGEGQTGEVDAILAVAPLA